MTDNIISLILNNISSLLTATIIVYLTNRLYRIREVNNKSNEYIIESINDLMKYSNLLLEDLHHSIYYTKLIYKLNIWESKVDFIFTLLENKFGLVKSQDIHRKIAFYFSEKIFDDQSFMDSTVNQDENEIVNLIVSIGDLTLFQCSNDIKVLHIYIQELIIYINNKNNSKFIEL